jgi:putative SOS response-associated peptidase YedK
MCGRYVSPSIRQIEEYFEVLKSNPLKELPYYDSPSYNVAPTQGVAVSRVIDGQQRLDVVRWGLIPFFARGEPPKYSTINARIETVETAATYRGPWKRGQRCLQFATGFYEWHVDANGVKQPYYIHLADQSIFAFAALWDRSFKVDVAIESCTHITMPGNELMRDIHNAGANPHRMPAILRREDHQAWLTGNLEEAKTVLQPYPAGLMVAHPVSKRVNTPRNNAPDLIEPIDATSADVIKT